MYLIFKIMTTITLFFLWSFSIQSLRADKTFDKKKYHQRYSNITFKGGRQSFKRSKFGLTYNCNDLI